MNSLISNGIVDSYAPLADIPGSYTAQFEHVSVYLQSYRWQGMAYEIARLYSCGKNTRKSSVVEMTTDDGGFLEVVQFGIR